MGFQSLSLAYGLGLGFRALAFRDLGFRVQGKVWDFFRFRV